MKMRLALLAVCGLAAGAIGYAQAPDSVVQRIRASAQFTQASTFIEGDHDRFVTRTHHAHRDSRAAVQGKTRATAYLELLRRPRASPTSRRTPKGTSWACARAAAQRSAGGRRAAHLDTVFPEARTSR